MSLFQIKDIPVGSIVVDNTWSFQQKSGQDYTTPDTTNAPVEWMVVDTNSHFKNTHYQNTTMGDHVTLFSNGVLSNYRLNNTNVNAPWDTRRIRTNFLRSTFYNSMSEGFKGRIAITQTKTGNSSTSGQQTTSGETVFLLSATELGIPSTDSDGAGIPKGAGDGVRIPFFTLGYDLIVSNKPRASTNPYFTRTPFSNNVEYVWTISGGGRTSRTTNAWSSDIWVRPSLNLKADTLVKNTNIAKTNAAGQTVSVYEIVLNQEPTITLNTNNNQTIYENSTIQHYNKTDFLFEINADDTDVNDTIEYSVWLNNVERTTWTGISKNVNTPYSIPHSTMLTGNNIVTVKVRDNNGGESVITFTLRNLTPISYSQKHVFELINSFI